MWSSVRVSRYRLCGWPPRATMLDAYTWSQSALGAYRHSLTHSSEWKSNYTQDTSTALLDIQTHTHLAIYNNFSARPKRAHTHQNQNCVISSSLGVLTWRQQAVPWEERVVGTGRVGWRVGGIVRSGCLINFAGGLIVSGTYIMEIKVPNVRVILSF